MTLCIAFVGLYYSYDTIFNLEVDFFSVAILVLLALVSGRVMLSIGWQLLRSKVKDIDLDKVLTMGLCLTFMGLFYSYEIVFNKHSKWHYSHNYWQRVEDIAIDSLKNEQRIRLINELLKRSSYINNRHKTYYVTHRGLVKPIKGVDAIVKDFELKEFFTTPFINSFKNVEDKDYNLILYMDYLASVSLSGNPVEKKGWHRIYHFTDGNSLNIIDSSLIKLIRKRRRRSSFLGEADHIAGIYRNVDSASEQYFRRRLKDRRKDCEFVRDPGDLTRDRVLARMILRLKSSYEKQGDEALFHTENVFLFNNTFITKFNTSSRSFQVAIKEYDAKMLLNNYFGTMIESLHPNSPDNRLYYIQFHDKYLLLEVKSFTKQVKMEEPFDLEENEWIESTSIKDNIILYEGHYFQFDDWMDGITLKALKDH